MRAKHLKEKHSNARKLKAIAEVEASAAAVARAAATDLAPAAAEGDIILGTLVDSRDDERVVEVSILRKETPSPG